MRTVSRHLHCFICGSKPQQSLVVAGHLLCTDCEETVVHSSCDDPHYHQLMQRMRAFWDGLAEVAATHD